jgi:hypothetical protein
LVPLTWPQIRLLQIIYEPFLQGAQWPMFQHVNALAWHELKDPQGEPLEPREVYFVLSASGLVRPPVQRDRTFDLRDDTLVRLSLLGLTHLNDASSDVSNFVDAVRYIGERAQNFRPASPTTAEHLKITSEEIRLTLRLEVGDRALLRLASLLQGEASGIWTSFAGPDPGAGWSLDIDSGIARRYRNIFTVLDILAVHDELRRAYAPIPVQYPSLEMESLKGRSMATNDAESPRVFVSYSHHDQEFVLALVDELTRQGIRVWIDQVELVVGDSLIRRIGDAIQEGDFVVGVISRESVESPWCQKELELAVTRGINEKRVTVLPIRLADVEMPSFLTDVLYAEGDDPATIASDLARAVETHLKRAGVETAIVPEERVTEGKTTAEGEAPVTVAAAERGEVVGFLGQIAERIDEVLIQWDRCRNAGAATHDLVAEQRRLRTLLDRLPDDVQRGLPLVIEVATASWQDYFRLHESAEAEADLREELRAIRSQVERGLPVVLRWRIVGGPDEVSSQGRDATAYLLRIEREDDNRPVVVYVSGSAMASSDDYLSADVVAAKATQGRSVVANLLSVDDPPREVMVSTEGVRWELT